MKTAKVTPWLPGKLKPVRVGLYQRQDYCETAVVYSYWNGKFWGFMEYDAAAANKLRRIQSYSQEQPWRGLATKPKRQAKQEV